MSGGVLLTGAAGFVGISPSPHAGSRRNSGCSVE